MKQDYFIRRLSNITPKSGEIELDEVFFKDKRTIDEIYIKLLDIYSENEAITVADYYKTLGITNVKLPDSFKKWGWSNYQSLQRTCVVPGGWTIEVLNSPEPLQRDVSKRNKKILNEIAKVLRLKEDDDE